MKIVYHYCSLDSFLQIITNKTIRLASMRHMNDPNELKWGFNKYLLTYDLTNEEKKKYEDKFQELSYNGSNYIINHLLQDIEDPASTEYGKPIF